MIIQTNLKLKSTHDPQIVQKIALSLAPDNLSHMSTEIFENEITIKFTTEKITTLIATMDDLLMNARIAEEILEKMV
jgi:hypothetical protein